MKPSMVKAGLYTAVTAAAFSTVAGLVPAVAQGSPVTPELPQRLAGKTVFLDPGHQGPNHNQDVARQVDDGRGGTKECQTSGMTTVNGVPEHTVNWNVAQLVRTSLEGLGARVVLSRPDDTGWGGCVDDRAKAANQSGADVAISIHADSAPATARGFHLIVPQLPVPDAKVTQVQSGAGLAASRAMRDAYVQAGFPVAAYNGADQGLQTRADVAGPALTTVPDVFLEMGNGANVEDAALLESPEGQLRHAVTITTGVVSYLLNLPVPATATDQVVGDSAAPPAQPALRVPPELPDIPGLSELLGMVPGAQPNSDERKVDPQAPGQAEKPGAQADKPAAPADKPAEQPAAPAPADKAAPAEQPAAPAPSQESSTVDPQSVPAPGADSKAGQGATPEASVAPQAAVPGQVAPAAPQAAPAEPAAPQAAPAEPAPAPEIEKVLPVPDKQVPAVRPIAAPLKANPPAPVHPDAIKPGFAAPAAVNPLLPNVAAPGAAIPNAAAPGATVPGAASPGAQSNPGVKTPGEKSTDVLDIESMSSLMQTAVKLLGPLAKMIMGQDGVASDLINVAYSLVSVLSSSLLSAPAK